jgi:hypothetical protein
MNYMFNGPFNNTLSNVKNTQHKFNHAICTVFLTGTSFVLHTLMEIHDIIKYGY